MNSKDLDSQAQGTEAERRPWVRPVVLKDKAAHAEGRFYVPYNHDGFCSS